MRKALMLLFTMLLVISTSTSVKAAPIQVEQPVIHAVLLYSTETSLQLFPQAETISQTTGKALAWVIMAIMIIALILVIMMVLRAFQGKPLKEVHGWLDMAIPILAIIGLGASIYLTYVELTHTRALCGPVGDCNAVQSSPYAKLFGIIPIGLVGALGYIAILVTWFWRRVQNDAFSKVAGPIMFAGTLWNPFLRLSDLS